jgi:hypothetical protein
MVLSNSVNVQCHLSHNKKKLSLTAISTLTEQKETLLFDIALKQEGAHDLEHVISHFVTTVIVTSHEVLDICCGFLHQKNIVARCTIKSHQGKITIMIPVDWTKVNMTESLTFIRHVFKK